MSCSYSAINNDEHLLSRYLAFIHAVEYCARVQFFKQSTMLIYVYVLCWKSETFPGGGGGR
jgi:hypothetical protein